LFRRGGKKDAVAFQAARELGLPSIIHLKIDPEAILPAATLSGIRGRALRST
jgi:acetolactate synthase I/II/III large subunit